MHVGNGGSRQGEKQVTSGQNIHNTKLFSKTHRLMLAMEGADKERNRLLLVKHTQHKTIISKTHKLMLAVEGADEEKNRLLLVKHTHVHNTRPFSKTHLLMLAMEGADMQGEKQVTFSRTNIHTYTTQDSLVKLTS